MIDKIMIYTNFDKCSMCRNSPTATVCFHHSTAFSKAVAVFFSLALHVFIYLVLSIHSHKAVQHKPTFKEESQLIRFSFALLPSEASSTAAVGDPTVRNAADDFSFENIVPALQAITSPSLSLPPLPLHLVQEESREMVENCSNELSELQPVQAAQPKSAGPFLRHRLQRESRPVSSVRPEFGQENCQPAFSLTKKPDYSRE